MRRILLDYAIARTMETRDLTAFRTFIAAGAVFFDGQEPLRGVDAIVDAWSPFFEGATAPFSRHPHAWSSTRDRRALLG